MKQRLNKIIAQSGICSRRKADELIAARRVRINGSVVTSLGTIADPDIDKIIVQNKSITTEKKVYILLNKPTGFTTTTEDKHAKKTVLDLLPELKIRLFPVGRLDKETSGLLILTNNGDLSYELTHPKFEINRVYEVVVTNPIDTATIKKLERGGMPIEDYKTYPCKIEVIIHRKSKSKLQITLHEGKKRQIRKMFDLIGHPVLELKRIQYGKLHLGDLKPGKWRYIEKSEIL